MISRHATSVSLLVATPRISPKRLLSRYYTYKKMSFGCAKLAPIAGVPFRGQSGSDDPNIRQQLSFSEDRLAEDAAMLATLMGNVFTNFTGLETVSRTYATRVAKFADRVTALDTKMTRMAVEAHVDGGNILSAMIGHTDEVGTTTAVKVAADTYTDKERHDISNYWNTKLGMHRKSRNKLEREVAYFSRVGKLM